VTIQASNGEAAVKRFLHLNTWKTRRSNLINSYVSTTLTSWALGGLYCLRWGGWIGACAAGIEEGIQLSVWMIESACLCKYLLEEGFKRSRWAIVCMERWKSGAIWALCWWRSRPSVSDGSGPSLQVQVRVQTEPLPNCRSGLSINPNRQLGYRSKVNSQPIWIGWVVSGSPSGSIYRFK
jgi:hypothetical protein